MSQLMMTGLRVVGSQGLPKGPVVRRELYRIGLLPPSFCILRKTHDISNGIFSLAFFFFFFFSSSGSCFCSKFGTRVV